MNLKKALEILKKVGVILYPTDTVWGIGCDATDENAVAKIFEIKQRTTSKSLVILVDGIEMLQQYIPKIPAKAIQYLNSTTVPTTVIYSNPIGLAKNTVASNNTVAIRIVQHKFCQQLIKAFGKPIVSTSANISGSPTPKSFQEIESAILESADYIVNLQRETVVKKASTIVSITENGEIKVLRK